MTTKPLSPIGRGFQLLRDLVELYIPGLSFVLMFVTFI